ncbi:MAG TPA: cytochrome c [Candidatus Binatia bacterium]|nr:cytochrome c [Candidatus Binatia bacterium]
MPRDALARGALVAALVVRCGASAVALAEDLPAEFAGRANPLAADAAAGTRGRALFLDNCAPCHGEAADGRGPASAGLTPPPANLAGPDIVPAHSDAYLFWRMSVGKRGSAMPSFQHSLSETERWEIVAYLRSLAERSRIAAKPPGKS